MTDNECKDCGGCVDCYSFYLVATKVENVKVADDCVLIPYHMYTVDFDAIEDFLDE